MDVLINTAMTALKSGPKSVQIVAHNVKKGFFLYNSKTLLVISNKKKFKIVKLAMKQDLNKVV